MKRSQLALSGLIFLAASSPALQAAPLGIGDPAPALVIDQWVQGAPVDLSKDAAKRVHLVEFWATWCPPCKMSVPILTEIQNKYKDELVIVGVTSSDTRGNTVDAIKKFVKDQGSKMSYHVAIDKGRATSKNFMDAADAQGIPHAFLVGKDGKIIWQGSPLDEEMKDVIDKVVKGTYDITAAKLEAEVNRRLDALNPALQRGQWDVVVTGLKEILKLDPANETALDVLLRIHVEQTNDVKSFRSWVDTHIAAHKNNSKAMAQLGKTLCSNRDPSSAMPDLALRAAKAAYEASNPRGHDATGVYALALYQIGAVDRAITVQEETLALATGDDRETAQRTLDYYKLCKQLQAGVTN